MCSFVAFTRGATEHVPVVHRKHNGDRRNIVLPVCFCVVLFLQITLYIIHSTTVNGFCFVCLFCRALHRIIKNMFLNVYICGCDCACMHERMPVFVQCKCSSLEVFYTSDKANIEATISIQCACSYAQMASRQRRT